MKQYKCYVPSLGGVVPHFFYLEYRCSLTKQAAAINWRWGLDGVMLREQNSCTPPHHIFQCCV